MTSLEFLNNSRDSFILYHFPWLTAAVLRYTESSFFKCVHLIPPVLDIGCGDGAFASFTFDHQLEIGLDSATSSSSNLSKSYRNTINASITKIPLKDSSVGTIISNSVMEHVKDLEQGLREVHRVLQSDGEFILTVPSAFSKDMSFAAKFPLIQHKAQKWLKWYNFRLHILNFLTPSQWQEMLAKNGFEIIRSKAYVQVTTMFWHTLFASLVLVGIKLFRRSTKRQRRQTGGVKKHNILALWFGRIWFMIFEKGYTAPLVDLSEGGYFFIRCKKCKTINT
ncbi:MAG: class I SAM-dependent methyltransferase [Thermodesulfobacteriota bacterium]